MLSLHTPRKPAPMLARGALWLGRRGGATAFGNAIGESIKDEAQASMRVSAFEEESRLMAAQRADEHGAANDAWVDEQFSAYESRLAADNRSALNAFNRGADSYYNETSYENWPDQTAAESAKHKRNDLTLVKAEQAQARATAEARRAAAAQAQASASANAGETQRLLNRSVARVC